MPATTTPRLILFADLRHKKGTLFSRSIIRRIEFAGMFPRHVHPSPGTTAWVEAEVDEHPVRVIAQRDAGQRRVDAMQQQTQHHGRDDPIQMGVPFGGGGHRPIRTAEVAASCRRPDTCPASSVNNRTRSDDIVQSEMAALRYAIESRLAQYEARA